MRGLHVRYRAGFRKMRRVRCGKNDNKGKAFPQLSTFSA